MAILGLLRDKERVQRMGLDGRVKLEKQFNLRDQVAKVQRVYEPAIG